VEKNLNLSSWLEEFAAADDRFLHIFRLNTWRRDAPAPQCNGNVMIRSNCASGAQKAH